MSRYVDGFVLSVPAPKLDQYKTIAEQAGKIWMEHGALEYVECRGDDMDVKEMLPFPKLAGAKKDEVVIFAYITYRSRAHRDEVNAKVMADPRLMAMGEGQEMPFDCKNMAYGGFATLVDYR